jgi:UDP-N-acetylmuramate-alanine ligase
MSEQKSLFHILKPEAKRNLFKNLVSYPNSVQSLIETLKSTFYVSDLTGLSIVQVHRYTDTETVDPVTLQNLSFTDHIYCTKIFKQDEKNAC